jgi:hypothetical protein
MAGFFRRILERMGLLAPEEPDLIRLKKGESKCSVCSVKIVGGKIYKVPGQEKHYCRTHGKEEAQKIREATFTALPEGLKGKVHFTLEEGYHLQCHSCSKNLGILNHEWSECSYCHEPYCADDLDKHVCSQKEEVLKEEELAKAAKRCQFCGRKITVGSSYHCKACGNFYCDMHQNPDHHDCKGVQ